MKQSLPAMGTFPTVVSTVWFNLHGELGFPHFPFPTLCSCCSQLPCSRATRPVSGYVTALLSLLSDRGKELLFPLLAVITNTGEEGFSINQKYFGEHIIGAILTWPKWSELKCTTNLRARSISSRPPTSYQLLYLSCWAVIVSFWASKFLHSWLTHHVPPFRERSQGSSRPGCHCSGLQIWISLQNSNFQAFCWPQTSGERWINVAYVTFWSFTPQFNEDPKFSSVCPVCTCSHFYQNIPQWAEIKEVFLFTEAVKKPVRSSSGHSRCGPHHVLLHVSPPALQGGHPPGWHPSLSPSPGCCRPQPTWKSCWTLSDPGFPVQSHTESILWLSQALLWAALLGLVCPISFRRWSPNSQLRVRQWCLTTRRAAANHLHPDLLLFCHWNMHSWSHLGQMS